MLKIAVCDDEQIILQKIENSIKYRLENFKIKYTIDSYLSGEKLLNNENINDVDVIFLDIELKSTNGIDVAKKLRANGYDNLIVFITSFIDYALDGYKANAFRFILKDNLDEELTECINNIISKLGLRKIKLNDLTIDISDIIYIESNKHKIIIHLKNDDTLKIYDTLDNIEKKLNSASLLRVHQSYLVNIMYITNIKCYKLNLLYCDFEIPIPKTKYSKIKKKINIKKNMWR